MFLYKLSSVDMEKLFSSLDLREEMHVYNEAKFLGLSGLEISDVLPEKISGYRYLSDRLVDFLIDLFGEGFDLFVFKDDSVVGLVVRSDSGAFYKVVFDLAVDEVGGYLSFPNLLELGVKSVVGRVDGVYFYNGDIDLDVARIIRGVL